MINPPLTTPLPIINGVWFSLTQNCQVNTLFYQLQTEMQDTGYLLPFQFSNVNCFTLLDESCHFSKTCTIKITGFQLARNLKTFPEKELLFPISSPFKRYIFEILPAFSHVSKHLISCIITLMMSCWGCQSYISLTSAQEWCAVSAPNLMKLWIDCFHSWYHLGWVEQT